MAKLTKAQQKEQDAVEWEAYQKTQADTYLARLMTALSAVSASGEMAMRVNQSMFVVNVHNSHQNWVLSPTYIDDDAELESLIGYIEYARQQQELQERKAILRQHALNKLTKEERELLNLK